MKIIIDDKKHRNMILNQIDVFLKECEKYNVPISYIKGSRVVSETRGIIYVLTCYDTNKKRYTLRHYTSRFIPRYHTYGVGDYVLHEYYYASLSYAVKKLLTTKGVLYKL